MGLTGAVRRAAAHLHRGSDPDIASPLARAARISRLLAHRFVAFFARAGIKYRPAASAEETARRTPAGRTRVAEALLALTGYATPHLRPRLRSGDRAAPALCRAVRPAARAPPTGWRRWCRTGSAGAVEVIEFAGAWLQPAARPAHPPAARARSRGHGTGSASMRRPACARGIRRRASSCGSARSIARVSRAAAGPAGAAPAGVAGARLSRLREPGSPSTRCWPAYEVPPLRLDAAADPPPRLGWNSWLPAPRPGRASRAAMPPTRCSRRK